MVLSALTLASCLSTLPLLAAFIPQQAAPATPEDIFAAVRASDLPALSRLIETGADVNSRDQMGSTPLLDAAWSGNLEFVDFLLAHGADVNAVHREAGSTALQYAVLNGRAQLAEHLLKAGARLDRRFRKEQTILHVAAARGNPEIVQELLTFHADLNALDGDDDTPLDEAVFHGHARVVEILIKSGADPKRTRARDGRGPLHEACIKGHASLIRLLVAAGADPDQRDNSGQTPLELALAYKNPGAVFSLLHLAESWSQSEQAAEKVMEAAALRGQVEVVRLLLDSGLNVNKPLTDGSTFLHDAAMKGRRAMVELLLDRGANIKALNSSGATPLHDAALGGNPEVIRLLLSRGAPIDARDAESGATPLMLAASLARASAVAALLDGGAHLTWRDSNGQTALDRALKTDDEATIGLLEKAVSHLRSENQREKDNSRADFRAPANLR